MIRVCQRDVILHFRSSYCYNDKFIIYPFPRGDNYEIAKIHWRNYKNLLLHSEPFSTKLGTMHLWVKEIQVRAKEGPRPFSRGDDYEIAKIHWRNWKILFSRTTEPISTKLWTKHPWMRGIQVSSNEEPINSDKVNNVFFPK